VITPSIDRYGKYAQASAIADYLELVALVHGGSPTRAAVADMIVDNNWKVKSAENFFVPDLEDEDEEVGDAVERIFNILAERRLVLGGAYPFHQDVAGRLTPANLAAETPYVAVLAITLAHAYQVTTHQAPEEVFEQTVTDVVTGRGWLGVNFRLLRRANANFAAALEASGPALGLQTDAGGAAYNVNAFDEGIDTVLHIPWCRTRRGRWTVIGQMTCAMSNEWKGKMKEPSPWTWAGLLGEKIWPFVFCAVPHHAEPRHRLYLIESTRTILLDRLSLIAHKAVVSPDEANIIGAVVGGGVETR
jgi:hypothetical protein